MTSGSGAKRADHQSRRALLARLNLKADGGGATLFEYSVLYRTISQTSVYRREYRRTRFQRVREFIFKTVLHEQF